MMKKHFITFSTSNWTKAKRRFNIYKTISDENNLFDSFDILDEKCLGKDFYDRFGNYINDPCFCYFAWKPYVILKNLEKIEDGRALVYMDSGCTLSENKFEFNNLVNKIDEKILELQKYKIKLGVGHNNYYHPNGNVEIQIKRQILQKFNLYDNLYFRKQFPHYEAGMLFIIKDEKTYEFIRRWYEFYVKYYETTIIYPNNQRFSKYLQDECYQLNNSDQSVLQCMLYEINGDFMSLGTFFYDNNICTRNRG